MVYASERIVEHNDDQLNKLVAQAMDRDDTIAQPAFAQLFERYSVLLWRRALGIVKRSEIADEIRQQAFTKAWASRASFWPGSNFAAWIYTITERLALDYTRRKFTNASSSLEQMGEETGFELVDPESLMDDDSDDQLERTAALQSALRIMAKTTPARTMEILQLYYFADTPTKAIADQFGMPEGTVHTILSRGREKLRKILNGDTDTTDESGSHGQSVVYEQSSERARVAVALQQLPDQAAARILRLSILDGLSDQAIADQSGKSKDAVASLLRRQRKILTELLGGTLPDLHSVTPRLDQLLQSNDPTHDHLNALFSRINNHNTVQTLRYHLIDGWSGTRIAQVTGEKENTIRVRILRGKEQLEELLAADRRAA